MKKPVASFQRPAIDMTPIFGIAGWSGSGKTTLIEKLIALFSERGLRVATIKHTHHNFEIDRKDSDTARHRVAGAAETAIVSGTRVAIIENVQSHGEPDLENIVLRMKPADLILVEGYKSFPMPKIEVRRAEASAGRPLLMADPFVLAIAADYDIDGQGRPVFKLDDIHAIASLIEETCGPFKTQRLHA